LVFGSFSTVAWNGTLPVPWHSPAAPPKVVFADEPKAFVEPPKPVDVPPPNGLVEVVPAVPKAGLFPPNNPPPVLLAPNGDDVVVLFEPKPPNPVLDPAVAVPLPNKLPPLVAAVPPKAGFAPPKALFWGVPKAPIDLDVSN
jgi:hypothetical protein